MLTRQQKYLNVARSQHPQMLPKPIQSNKIVIIQGEQAQLRILFPLNHHQSEIIGAISDLVFKGWMLRRDLFLCTPE